MLVSLAGKLKLTILAHERWRFFSNPTSLSFRFLFTPTGLLNGRPNPWALANQFTKNGGPLIL
jgi:hypothetical protein